MPALGIDLIIIAMILYVAGAAAQDMNTQRAYYANLFCFPLSLMCFLLAPWFIV